jgi:hypothetical protein
MFYVTIVVELGKRPGSYLDADKRIRLSAWADFSP